MLRAFCCTSNIEDFHKIKIGMNDHVLDLVSTPHQMSHEEGNGKVKLTYKLRDDVMIEVTMNSEVIAARQIMDGAIVDIL